MTEERKEIYSIKVSAGRRTYFFDVKESSEDGFDRNSVCGFNRSNGFPISIGGEI